MSPPTNITSTLSNRLSRILAHQHRQNLQPHLSKPQLKPSFFRITLHRSAIGLPKRTQGVLKALGLKKRMKTVYQPVSQDSAGMIFKVKELVKVEEVSERKSKGELKRERRPEGGFWVEKSVMR